MEKDLSTPKEFTKKDIENINDKLAYLIEERRKREEDTLPVPDGPRMTGARGGSKVGSAPAFGNTSEYDRARSRQITRDKIKNNNSRIETNMRVHSYRHGIGNNNTKINNYRTNSANTNNNRYNTGNTTRLNQRRNIR